LGDGGSELDLVQQLVSSLEAVGAAVGLEGTAAIVVPLAVPLALIAGWLVLRGRSAPGGAEAMERTIQELIERSQYERAGELRMSQGQFEKALALFTNARNHHKAALCYLALKQPLRAAEMYARIGRHSEAAHYFQAAGALREAAGSLEALGQQKEAAALLERAGDLPRAARLYAAVGDAENAARLFERSGLGVEAASALLEGKRREPAAMRRAAELFHRAGELHRAGECFAAAGEWVLAGETFEAAGEHTLAAHAFERGSNWDAAAAAYERAGALPEARTNYERAGDLGRAAEVALRMGTLLEAGRAFFQLGAYERAIETLSQIAADSPQFRRGSLLLGRIFLEKGLLERARQRLESIPLSDPPTKDDLEALSLLADVCEKASDIAGAVQALERVAAVDENYQDASRRIDSLQEKLWSESNPPPGYYDARYELREELGRGGMGVVYLANDRELGRSVAIKFLPGELAINPAAVAMFRAEARATAAMNHANIVHVYDVAVIAGRPCIVMEYVQGKTVRQLMKSQGRGPRGALSPARVLDIARQTAVALAYAHSRNVIHRDVKPGNILISESGEVKLMDFGISKVLEAGGSQTQAKGTPQYMPPEQILGREVDGRTDLYALGISMFEMATGRRPFMGEDVVDQQLHAPIPDPRQLNPEIPEAMCAIMSRACEKDPRARYASAEEMAEAIARALAAAGS
jgi:tetratricopeptide (TPR) repeat protein